MTKLGEFDRVTFTAEDATDDSLPCNAHDVTAHDTQLDVYRMQGFLHVQDIGCAPFD
jgi:hypothetical protein